MKFYSEKRSILIFYSIEIIYSFYISIICVFRLQHKDVFNLIKKHNLYDVINRTIVPLIQLDSERAIAMLLERNKIPSDVVIEQLKDHEEYLYMV